jgi:hypothetical protein
MLSSPEATSSNLETLAEPTVIHWSDAIQDIIRLEPGTIVSGMNDLEELDLFTHNLGMSLKVTDRFRPTNEQPDIHLSNTGRSIYRGWSDGARRPSQVIKPKNFYGKLKNIQAIMLGDISHGEHQSPAKDFIISAEMHTSGVGKRGQILKHCTVSTLMNDFGGGNVLPSLITATYKNIGNQSPEQIAERIIEESRDVSRKVVVSGLKSVLSGGLPGRGKNSR